MITTYTETTTDLKVNKIDRETFDTLSAEQISPQELWFITSADSVVVDIDKIGQGGGGGHDYGPEISELSANKRDYDDLTYNDKTVRAPTYGIDKMIATPSDGTDPVVMDRFFIHENPSDPSDSLGSTWYAASFVFAGTTDGTNFRMVNIGFQTLATFTKTQLLAGEVTFTFQDKTWTLIAELGDGMVDSFDITINEFTCHTSHYDYDPQTKTSKWWNQQDGFFLTRSWTSSITLSNFWLASLYRGDDGVHGNVKVASFNIGGTVGYRGGGYFPSFTYGDITQPIEWQVAGYPCQGTFGFSECVPTRNSQLVNDSYFVRQSEISALSSEIDDVNSQIQELDLSAIQQELSSVQDELSAMEELADYFESLSAIADLSAVEELVDGKRDYDDLTYGGTYDPTDAEGYYGITSWHIAGYKFDGQTLPAFDTSTRFKNNQTYGTGWNDGYTAIHTSPSNPSDFSTLYLDGFGNADPVPFTLSLDKTTYEFSFMGREQQNLTLTANLANADRLALNSQLSAYVTSAWVMNYVNDQISAALEAQV